MHEAGPQRRQGGRRCGSLLLVVDEGLFSGSGSVDG